MWWIGPNLYCIRMKRCNIFYVVLLCFSSWTFKLLTNLFLQFCCVRKWFSCYMNIVFSRAQCLPFHPLQRCCKKKISLRPQYRHTQTIHLTDVKCLFALKVSWNDIIKMHRQKSTTITNGLRNLVTCFILICFFQYSKRFQVNNLKVDTILSVCIFFLSTVIFSPFTRQTRATTIEFLMMLELNVLIW